MKKYLISLISGILGGTPGIAQTLKTPAFSPPERGFISSTPAETWEHGLISGNGSIGANVLSRPLQETVIFTHERLFLPQGPPHMPPDNAARLFEIRSLIARGLYKQATNLQFDLSGQEGFMYPDPFVPAFDLNITMDTEKEIKDYVRSVNFQTGEATVHWADSHGAYERRLFVSRADGVAVMLITGPGQGAVNCTLALSPRQVDEKLGAKTMQQSAEVFNEHVSKVKTHAEKLFLTYTNSFSKAYPGSIHALEGLASVVASGGHTEARGDTLVVSGADQVLVLVDIRLLYDPDQSQLEDSANHLAGMGADYPALLQRHAAIHGALFQRVRLDLADILGLND